jgi:hypothetical protein
MGYADNLVRHLQPDGTQGIATIDLKKNGSVMKTLVGCVVCIPSKEKSHRNILKVEENQETKSKVKYFVICPWFTSCRPSTSEITSVLVKLYRFRKKRCDKQFEVSGFDFDRYKDDDHLVIPCEKNNFKRSSFLKKWSSKLLLHNNSGQMFQANKSFTGFKKDSKLFKFCKFDIKEKTSGTGYEVEEGEFNELEEHGILLIPKDGSTNYVVGSYMRESSQIKISCFFFKGNNYELT